MVRLPAVPRIVVADMAPVDFQGHEHLDAGLGERWRIQGSQNGMSLGKLVHPAAAEAENQDRSLEPEVVEIQGMRRGPEILGVDVVHRAGSVLGEAGQGALLPWGFADVQKYQSLEGDRTWTRVVDCVGLRAVPGSEEGIEARV